jgi:hypothetical protein
VRFGKTSLFCPSADDNTRIYKTHTSLIFPSLSRSPPAFLSLSLSLSLSLFPPLLLRPHAKKTLPSHHHKNASFVQDKKASPENISKLGASTSSAGQGSKDDSQVPTQKSPIRSAASKMAAPAPPVPALTALGALTAGAAKTTPAKSQTASGTGTALSALKKMPAAAMVASLVPFSAAASRLENAPAAAASPAALPPPAALGAPAVPDPPVSVAAMLPPPGSSSEGAFVRRPRAVSSIF